MLFAMHEKELGCLWSTQAKHCRVLQHHLLTSFSPKSMYTGESTAHITGTGFLAVINNILLAQNKKLQTHCFQLLLCLVWATRSRVQMQNWFTLLPVLLGGRGGQPICLFTMSVQNSVLRVLVVSTRWVFLRWVAAHFLWSFSIGTK